MLVICEWKIKMYLNDDELKKVFNKIIIKMQNRVILPSGRKYVKLFNFKINKKLSKYCVKKKIKKIIYYLKYIVYQSSCSLDMPVSYWKKHICQPLRPISVIYFIK